MKKKNSKTIIQKPSKVHIYIWIEGNQLRLVFVDRSGDEFFKMNYLLTDGRKIHDPTIKETVRTVINRHMPIQSSINITFWKYNGHIKKTEPTKDQLKFERALTLFIRDRTIGHKIDLQVI